MCFHEQETLKEKQTTQRIERKREKGAESKKIKGAEKERKKEKDLLARLPDSHAQ